VTRNEKCPFCQIVDGGIPAAKSFENERVMAFKDINPAAPVHYLIIPKAHIATANDLAQDKTGLAGEMILTAARLAEEAGIAESGYRLIMNCNSDGGQLVFHVHLHLIGGKPLGGLIGAL